MQVTIATHMPAFNRSIRALAVIAFAFLFIPFVNADKTDDRLAKRGAKIATTIENIQIEDASRIPAAVIRKAKGIIILRQFEAGFIFGGKGGFGLAMKRNENGEWGPPAWIKTGEGSWGLQIGVQTLNVVLLIMNEEGMEMLEKAKFRIGVDAAATAGPTGRTAEIKSGIDSPILSYTDTEGFYAGATFEGGFLMPDNKSNLAVYDDWLSVPEILENDELDIPPYACRVIELLKKIEKE